MDEAEFKATIWVTWHALVSQVPPGKVTMYDLEVCANKAVQGAHILKRRMEQNEDR